MHEVNKNIFPLEWKLTDKIPVKKHNKKVFGTFICGGGSTMGYKLAGYDTLGGVEFLDKYAEVYKKNFNPKYLFIEDIREFNQRQDLPKELYNLDLLDGSPPCAAFSTSGKREKSWGIKTAYEEVLQVKDDLVYVYSDTILKLLPKVFILENVSGLIKANAKIYVKNVLKKLSGKYNVQIFLLNAASMGIPQLRPRIFIVGLKKEYSLSKLELGFNCDIVNFSITKKYWKHKDNVNRDILNYSIGKLWDEIKIGKEHKKRFSLHRNSPNKPSYTIQASDAFVGTAGVCHPFQKRKLNIEEVRMCCTFPLDYNFNNEDPINIMGRSVLPVMMANIAHQIYLQWLSKI